MTSTIPAFSAGPAADRIQILPLAADHVLKQARDDGQESHKDFGKRYLDVVAALAKAFKLAAGSREAKKHAEEVAFFLAVRSALQKLDVTAVGGEMPHPTLRLNNC